VEDNPDRVKLSGIQINNTGDLYVSRSETFTCRWNGFRLHAKNGFASDPSETPGKGAREARVSEVWPVVTGKTLLDMEREDYGDPATQAQSKQLMRFLLAHHLGGVPLNTRQILIDLMQL